MNEGDLNQVAWHLFDDLSIFYYLQVYRFLPLHLQAKTGLTLHWMIVLKQLKKVSLYQGLILKSH